MAALQWAALILGLVNFLTRLISYVEMKKYISEGEQKAIANALRKQAEDMDKARAARARAADDAQRVPDDQSLPDDGFRRD